MRFTSRLPLTLVLATTAVLGAHPIIIARADSSLSKKSMQKMPKEAGVPAAQGSPAPTQGHPGAPITGVPVLPTPIVGAPVTPTPPGGGTGGGDGSGNDGNPIAVGTYTDVDDDALLQVHNEKRAYVGASPLTWDDTIAQYARNLSQLCSFQHSSSLTGPGTGTNPGDGEDQGETEQPDYSENMAGAYDFDKTPTMTLFNAFWAEGQACNYQSSGCDVQSAGHYMNIIANTTTKLGCGVAKCPASLVSQTQSTDLNNGTSKFLVCDYAP